MISELSYKKQRSRWYDLIPHKVQMDLVDAVKNGTRFPLVPAGRRCLEKGTLVATKNGGVAIEELNIGDEVVGYNNGVAELTTVTNIFNNGLQEVTPLLSGGRKYLAGTNDHKLFACNEMFYDKRKLHLKENYKYKKTEISKITARNRVKKQYSYELITGGKKQIKDAYILGALLGDGCSRESKSSGDGIKNIYISADDNKIPKYIANFLSCRYKKNKKNKGNNYTYAINVGNNAINKVSFYKQWCCNRYAHEKIAEWDEVDKWDKKSCLKFLAGVIDTDGSIYYKNKKTKKECLINISMQAESVVDVCSKIISKYFQENVGLNIDKREKYKNGFVYSIKTTSNLQAIRIIKEIDKYLIKKNGFDLSTIELRNVLEDRIGFKKGESYKAQTYDITVSNDSNMYILHNGGIVTSNSGKTERFKRALVKAASNEVGMYFAAAPTYSQVKKIFWKDLKEFSLSVTHERRPSESDLIIFLPNGSEIHCIGLDKPERIEGIPWTGGGIDEFADIKPDAWEANIYPALNTVDPRNKDYRAWCWLLGVPDGLNHYYDLCQLAETGQDEQFKVFHWKSAEILPPDVIESAKKAMSAKQYRQEFEASFETATGRIYEDYSKDNYTDREIQSHEQLLWMHDQNYTPLSSSIGIRDKDNIYLLDEIVLESAVSRQSAEEFVEKFKDHKNKNVLIYGDPSGKNGEKHGHASDYTDIEDVLRDNGWKYSRRIKRSHPAIKDRQNCVRAKIKTASGNVSLFVNIKKAPWSHKGLATVQLQKGSSFQEDQKNQYQHITTAIGYMIEYEFSLNVNVITTGIGSAR